MKVIGAGFGRTGTASLQSALQDLGFGPCYHMYEVFEHPGHADFWQAALRGEPVDWDDVHGRALRNRTVRHSWRRVGAATPGAKQ